MKYEVYLFIGNVKEKAYGLYSEEQIKYIENEMLKPISKRNYVLGIEFSEVNRVEFKAVV